MAGGVRPCPEESHRQNGEGDLKFSQVMKPGCPPSPSPERKGELLGVLAGGGSRGGGGGHASQSPSSCSWSECTRLDSKGSISALSLVTSEFRC